MSSIPNGTGTYDFTEWPGAQPRLVAVMLAAGEGFLYCDRGIPRQDVRDIYILVLVLYPHSTHSMGALDPRLFIITGAIGLLLHLIPATVLSTRLTGFNTVKLRIDGFRCRTCCYRLGLGGLHIFVSQVFRALTSRAVDPRIRR